MNDLLGHAQSSILGKVARPHQTRALDLLRDSMRAGHRRPLLQLPTGAGKTFIAIQIVKGTLAKGKRVMFVVPSIALIGQTIEAFKAEGILSLGVIQANHPLTDWSCDVQIASVQTLARRPRFPTDLVIVDEAHLGAQVIRKWMAIEPGLGFIGLTATPWRKGMAEEYDDLIIGATMSDLIAQGVLSDFRAFAPSHPDLSKLKVRAGDFETGALSAVMRKPQIVADVVTTWLGKGEDRPTFCFCVDRAHAAALKASFERAGVSSGYIDAKTDAVERDLIRRRFHDGEIRVVCNVGVLTTGIDWDVRCIILAGPTKSEMLYVQMVGRGLRTALGKSDCLILDHSDNTQRLGFVTEVGHDQLLGGTSSNHSSRKKPEAMPAPCPKCTFLKPPGCMECPNCGFTAERQNKVVMSEGELSQVAGERKRATKAVQQAWFSQLLKIASDHGYKPVWVRYTFLAKFGVTPSRLALVTAQPTPEVRNYVKSRLIAYNKKGKAHAA